MTVDICDRCGDVTVADDRCRCETPCNPVEVRRRHRNAVARARATDAQQVPRPEARPAA